MYNFKNRAADKRIIYKTVDGIGLPMDIYLPDSETNMSTKCIAVIHGGGWNDAIKDNSLWDGGMMKYQARYYASRGYIGIAFSYRSLKAYEGITVCDLVEDCKAAVRYIKKMFNKELILFGESAGGHLASVLGISEDDSIRPEAVVACNPVLDCTREKWLYGFECFDDARKFSPIYQKPEKSAKFLFLHGNNDTVTEIEDTEKFSDKLTTLGHYSKKITVKDAQHAFILFDYRSSNEEIMTNMKLIDEFIETI